jgi:hypothetical protein
VAFFFTQENDAKRISIMRMQEIKLNLEKAPEKKNIFTFQVLNEKLWKVKVV